MLEGTSGDLVPAFLLRVGSLGHVQLVLNKPKDGDYGACPGSLLHCFSFIILKVGFILGSPGEPYKDPSQKLIELIQVFLGSLFLPPSDLDLHEPFKQGQRHHISSLLGSLQYAHICLLLGAQDWTPYSRCGSRWETWHFPFLRSMGLPSAHFSICQSLFPILWQLQRC